MMATVFEVRVKLSWGKEGHYLVANDVEPGLAHRLATRKNWQEVMINALINVPVAPYLPDKSVLPPMATGKVVAVEAVDDQDERIAGLQRTRSQFIMAAIWQKQSETADYNYLRHDYVPETQQQIKADVAYWKRGVATPAVVKQTQERIAEQQQRWQDQQNNLKK